MFSENKLNVSVLMMILKQRVVENYKSKLLIFPIVFGLVGVTLVKFQSQIHEKICKSSAIKQRPTYMLYDRHGPTSQILSAVDNVLGRLHMDKIDMTNRFPENITLDWDLFWCFHHQDAHKMNWSSLRYHQKINHFPGNYALVSKSVLGTKTNSKYVPKAFLKAENVVKYAAENPAKLFVMKLKSNRGVKLVKPENMNFTATASIDDYFAQEFIQNPLLWNGYKFDFSIFVVITSVDPLRLYYYDKTINLRFCAKPYSIADPEDTASYVIATEHISGQHFGPVKNYVTNGYTNKEAFESFMRSKGANLTEIWLKAEDLIRTIAMGKEQTMIDGVSLNLLNTLRLI